MPDQSTLAALLGRSQPAMQPGKPPRADAAAAARPRRANGFTAPGVADRDRSDAGAILGEPGQATLTFDLTDPQLLCSIPGHAPSSGKPQWAIEPGQAPDPGGDTLS